MICRAKPPLTDAELAEFLASDEKFLADLRDEPEPPLVWPGTLAPAMAIALLMLAAVVLIGASLLLVLVERMLT